MSDKLMAEWFWIDRWIGSSAAGLPIEPRGLYREMLTRAWRMGATLPNDHDAIRRLAGCTLAEWRRCWPQISKYWTVSPCGLLLINETQVEIYAEAVNRHLSAVNRGKKGGRPKAELSAELKPSFTTTEAEPKYLSPSLSLNTSSLCSDVPPLPPPLSGGGPSPDDLADLWAELCPTMSQPDRPLAAGVRKQLTAALKREGSRDWYAAFERIGASPKLRGEEFDWQCPGILWAVGPKNLAALDSGQHDGKTNRVRSKTRTLYDGAMDALERMQSNDARQEFLPVGDDSAPDAT